MIGKPFTIVKVVNKTMYYIRIMQGVMSIVKKFINANIYGSQNPMSF